LVAHEVPPPQGSQRATDNVQVRVVGQLASVAFFVGFFLMLVGPLLLLIDRRALRRGRPEAFRKGWLIASGRATRASGTMPTSRTFEPAAGEGQWLSDEVFGFWSRATYRHSNHSFGWIGLGIRHQQEVILEVRLLRANVATQAGQLLALTSFVVMIAVADWKLAIPIALVGLAYLRRSWRMFFEERSIARKAVDELRRKFEAASTT
jgi:hypothetical protein